MSEDGEGNSNDEASSINSMNIGINDNLTSPGSDLDALQDNTEFDTHMVLTVAKGKVITKNRKRELQGFDRRNFILYQHFIRSDFDACKALVKVIMF